MLWPERTFKNWTSKVKNQYTDIINNVQYYWPFYIESTTMRSTNNSFSRAIHVPVLFFEHIKFFAARTNAAKIDTSIGWVSARPLIKERLHRTSARLCLAIHYLNQRYACLLSLCTTCKYTPCLRPHLCRNLPTTLLNHWKETARGADHTVTIPMMAGRAVAVIP